VQRHVDRLLVEYEAARAGVVFHRTDDVSEGLL
jgi:hypothetical protein